MHFCENFKSHKHQLWWFLNISEKPSCQYKLLTSSFLTLFTYFCPYSSFRRLVLKSQKEMKKVTHKNEKNHKNDPKWPKTAENDPKWPKRPILRPKTPLGKNLNIILKLQEYFLYTLIQLNLHDEVIWIIFSLFDPP